MNKFDYIAQKTHNFACHVTLGTRLESQKSSSGFSAVWTAPHQGLCFQGRFNSVEAWAETSGTLQAEDPEFQLAIADEFYPWHIKGIPDILAPLCMIEYNNFTIAATPMVVIGCVRDGNLMRKRINRYGLNADLDTESNRNIGTIGYDPLTGYSEIVYDLGALRLPKPRIGETLAQRKQHFSNFKLLECPSRGGLTVQINLWKERNYDLRSIYEKAQSFADQTGGVVTLAPNPNVMPYKASSHPTP